MFWHWSRITVFSHFVYKHIERNDNKYAEENYYWNTISTNSCHNMFTCLLKLKKMNDDRKNILKENIFFLEFSIQIPGYKVSGA